ncbi:hypothetical protein Aph01nite_37930 [Acrocarpospora phusangensis]|uniref:L,D-TPase catalytic domain-containing protein n=1 Tax=Acrocarpospora phusangensis TaxID=1070424 RepID=A0A919QDJ3_9ACTN|nr:L,D-transpeptidase family protein [Acrocarpospora phusangensis]GIH25483.1 hypothetical protein Aph01nite_37930 [Acrocarpospora phusangensis]
MRVPFLLSIATGSAIGVLVPVFGDVLGATAHAEIAYAKRAVTAFTEPAQATPAQGKPRTKGHNRARGKGARHYRVRGGVHYRAGHAKAGVRRAQTRVQGPMARRIRLMERAAERKVEKQMMRQAELKQERRVEQTRHRQAGRPHHRRYEEPRQRHAERPQPRYASEPRQRYAEESRPRYVEQPQQRYAERPQPRYMEEPLQRFAEEPRQGYFEQPQSRYSDDSRQRYAEQPQQRYAERPQSRYAEQDRYDDRSQDGYSSRPMIRPISYPQDRPRAIAPMNLPDGIKRHLPRVTTWSTLPRVPRDHHAFARTSGRILHPTKPKIVYGRPGGKPIGVLPTHLVESPTWVPVVDSRPDWARVLLPSRPNHSTGWIHTGSGGVQYSHSDYRINVDLSSHRMSIHRGGRVVGSWRVATGAARTPTPVGRTFVMSAVDTGKGYGVPVLPLGTHSPTLRTFDGGPATIGLHGWSDSSVFGQSVSNGCVRVPRSALQTMAKVPMGTVVTIGR